MCCCNKEKHQRHHEKKARLVIVAAVNPCLEVFSGVEKDRDFFAFLPLPVLYVEWFLHAWEILVGKTKCCRHWVQWIKKPIKKNSVSNPLQRTLMYRLYFLYLWYKMKFFSQYNYLSIFWDMKQRKLRHDTQFGGQKYEKNKHAQQFWRKKHFSLPGNQFPVGGTIRDSLTTACKLYCGLEKPHACVRRKSPPQTLSQRCVLVTGTFANNLWLDIYSSAIINGEKFTRIVLFWHCLVCTSIFLSFDTLSLAISLPFHHSSWICGAQLYWSWPCWSFQSVSEDQRKLFE